MNFYDFERHMKRLISTFGADKYPGERLQILFQNLKDTDAEIFGMAVERLIANQRTAPLLAQFQSEITLVREQRHYRSKEQYRKEAEAFWRSSFHPDEVKHIAECIRLRMQGQINDAQWAEFLQILKPGAA